MKTCLSYIFCFIFIFKFSGGAFGQVSVCVGSSTNLSSATTGGTWTSSNMAIATVGLTTGVTTGVSAGTVTMTYNVSGGTSLVSLTVNALPVLSSELTMPAICDTTVLNYSPTSATAGTTFAWSQPYIPGIGSAATSGTGNVNEQLTNSTNVPIPVTYIYTLSANGCSDTQDVTVTVYPTPVLSSTLMPPAICDTFMYLPTSFTPGATYAWDRPEVAGITPATTFGVDSIFEVLHNATISPIVVTYDIRLGISLCPNLAYQTITVTVDPCSFLSVSETANLSNGMSVYPNPAHDFFTIDIPGNISKAVIKISDVLGRVMETRNLATVVATGEKFNVERFSAGTYFIEVESGPETYHKTLVVQ